MISSGYLSKVIGSSFRVSCKLFTTPYKEITIMDKLIMSKKEMEQVKVFELLKMNELSQQAAAIRLNMTTRSVKKVSEIFKNRS